MTGPEWWRIRDLIVAVDEHNTASPSAISDGDQLQAFFTNRLVGLGVDVRDPERLYGALVLLGVTYEAAGRGADTGVLSREEEVGVKRLTLTIASALGRLLPAEART